MHETKKRLLVLGAGGLLGSELLNNGYLSDWDIIGHGRVAGQGQHADLSNRNETHCMLDAVTPDAIINLVSLTDVDRCESFPDEAYAGNVKTLENVTSWIELADNGPYLINISTDQVYDGYGSHGEMDVSLKNYYAFSKYTGELVARTVQSVILRTNFFGKSKCSHRSSLTDWLFNSLTERKSIQVFDDVLFSPLSMHTLAEMIALVLRKKITGIYNLGSRDGLSKADFAYCFAHELNLESHLMSRTTTDAVSFLKTYRPKDMRMDVGRFEQAFGVVLPSLKDEIKRVAVEYLGEI